MDGPNYIQLLFVDNERNIKTNTKKTRLHKKENDNVEAK